MASGEVIELLLSSATGSGSNSISVWDWRVGTCLQQYKNGGVIKSHTTTFIGDDTLMAAEIGKPLIHVWPLNSEEPTKNKRVVCSGTVSALTTSPDGRWCAAGIGDQLFLWQISSGQLLATTTKHFQTITKIEFSKDGCFLVSGGEDALVIVWSLTQLLNSDCEPLHTLSHHSLPVTDLCLSQGTSDVHLYTVSADCTMAVHQLLSGQLLLSIVFDESLTAVAVASWGPRIFTGTVTGAMHEVILTSPPRDILHDSQSCKTVTSKFSHHKKAITALSISADGQTLASGSTDGELILWHIATRQKLRTLPHAGDITNVSFISAPRNLFAEAFQASTIFGGLQRGLSTKGTQTKTSLDVLHSEDVKLPFQETVVNSNIQPSLNFSANDSNLQTQIHKLRSVNVQLYQFCLDSILTKVNTSVPEIDTFDNINPSKKKRRN